MSFSKHNIFKLSSLFILIASVSASTVYAKTHTDEPSPYITIQTEPTFYVSSDGQSYTGLNSSKHPLDYWNIAALVSFSYHSDYIKSWSGQIKMTIFDETWTGSKIGKSYKVLHRPTSIYRQESFPITGSDIEQFAVQTCETNATIYRSNGASNQQIFSHEYSLPVEIYASSVFETKYKLGQAFETVNHYSPKTARIICMKEPTPTVEIADDIQIGSGVVDTSLNIIEQTTVGGACKVNLATVIESNLPNTTVQYRFEHSNGNKSDIKTVTTDHSKIAMDSHWYNIANNPNDLEEGQVRMIGVSHDFQSSWKSYSMDCKKPSTNTLSLVTKPKVEVEINPISNILHNGMLCPSKVEITAHISHDKAFSGTGTLTLRDGSHTFLSHAVDIAPNSTQSHRHFIDLEPWDTTSNASNPWQSETSNTIQSEPGASSAAPSQRFELRYSLATNNVHVVITPFKTVVVRCTSPQVNPNFVPSNNQGLTVQPQGSLNKKIEGKFIAPSVQQLPQPSLDKLRPEQTGISRPMPKPLVIQPATSEKQQEPAMKIISPTQMQSRESNK